MRAHDFGIGAKCAVIKVNLLAARRHAQWIPAHEAVRNNGCNFLMHGALRGLANDPSQEGFRKRTLCLDKLTQKSIVTGISSMEGSDCIAPPFEAANLLAN